MIGAAGSREKMGIGGDEWIMDVGTSWDPAISSSKENGPEGVYPLSLNDTVF